MIQLFSPGKRPILPGHVGDTTFLSVQKPISPQLEHLAVAFDFAYDIKVVKLIRKKNYDK